MYSSPERSRTTINRELLTRTPKAPRSYKLESYLASSRKPNVYLRSVVKGETVKPHPARLTFGMPEASPLQRDLTESALFSEQIRAARLFFASLQGLDHHPRVSESCEFEIMGLVDGPVQETVQFILEKVARVDVDSHYHRIYNDVEGQIVVNLRGQVLGHKGEKRLWVSSVKIKVGGLVTAIKMQLH